MSLSSAALTTKFPRASEKTFLLAPQPSKDAAATTGFTSLHYMNYDPDRAEDVAIAREYGDGSTGLDPVQVDYGDVNVSGPLQTQLCLNEIGFHLAFVLGLPTSSGPDGSGIYTHVFKSGAAQLPYATLVDTDSQAVRTARSVIYSGLSINIAKAGGIQRCDFQFKGMDLAMDLAAPANPSASPARLFVQQRGFRALLGGVELNRLLSASLTYSPDIAEDRYVRNTAGVDEFYVGDPTLQVGMELRHVTEAQRAQLGGIGNDAALTLIGDGPSGSSIEIAMPRIAAPIVMPKADDKLQKLVYSGQALATPSGTPAPMMTVTLKNTVASY